MVRPPTTRAGRSCGSRISSIWVTRVLPARGTGRWQPSSATPPGVTAGTGDGCSPAYSRRHAQTRRAELSAPTNTVIQVIPTVGAMTTLSEVQTWIAEQLPALIEKYDVPGAAVAVLAGGEVVDDAAGLLHTGTGVEATPDSLFQIGSVTKLWTSTLVMQLV